MKALVLGHGYTAGFLTPLLLAEGWQVTGTTRDAPQRVLAAGATPLPDYAFTPDDVLLLGAESSGVPPYVHDAVAARVAIPMQPGFRSLNVAVAAGIALAEALRQTKGFPA